MKTILNRRLIILSMLLSGFMGLSIDILIPSLGEVSSSFNLSPGHTQLVISVFIFSFAIMQLIQGPLSDYYGRKSPLIVSLLVFIVASIACALSESFFALVFFRAFQAFGAANAIVTSYALIRDFFEGNKYAKAMSYVIISRSLLPVILSILGGMLGYYLGWRFVFVGASIIAALIVIYSYFLIDEKEKATKKIHFGSVVNDYKLIIKNKTFLSYNFLGIAEFTMLLTYLTAFPFISQHNINNSTLSIGIYIAINSLFLVLGSWITACLIGRISDFRLLAISTVVMIIAGLFLFTMGLYSVRGAFATLFPLYLFSIGCGMISPIGMSLLLKPFKEKSAHASAISGFFRFVVASSLLNIVLHFKELQIAVSLIILCLSLSCLFVISYSKKLNIEVAQ